MNERIPIGQQVTETVKFRAPFPQFSTPPLWDIQNPDGQVILSGSSILSVSDPTGWDVTFTIPTNYLSRTDNDTLVLELYGTDITGKMRSVDRFFSLMDAADDFLPTTWLVEDNDSIDVSHIFQFNNIDPASIKLSINDYAGVVLAKNINIAVNKIMRVADRKDVPDRFTEHEFRGYRYDISAPGIRFPALTRAPYQLNFKIDSATPKLKETVVHKVIRMNSRFYEFTSSLKQYLDKARLVEIDPTLQWTLDELAVSVIDGINYINSHPAVFTFWTADDIPLPMTMIVRMAAAYDALNKRYLAEGFNEFEFSGLSTQLTFGARRETLSYKIEEIKAYLDTNLTTVKSNAIATFGKGTPDPSVMNSVKEARAIIRTQPSPVHNLRGYNFGPTSMLRSAPGYK